ncbi:MAG: pantoate--beta-alanine ligase [SAR202 cluster bacterium]|nr:pantoate--beta-alanine ligase [SAR202 cluster bacterium]
MRVIESICEMREVCQSARRPLGLAPTMGYLHDGHRSLVKRARDENATVAVSIFVNPTQFGPREDYSTYPQDMDRDLSLLEGENVDVVFAPRAEEMYPGGLERWRTWVEVMGMTERLEGEFRPGHFRGVGTVVAKLLNIVRPDRAYFGRKDAQQLAVIRRVARDLDLGADIVACPTVRERDGLAMSSRNVFLTPEERRAAPVIYYSLRKAQEMHRQGERDGERLRSAVCRELEGEPLIKAVDYVSVADPGTMEEVSTVEGPSLLLAAVRMGRVRLIDNVELGGLT